MSLKPLSHRLLIAQAAPEAFAPMTRVILTKLGYATLTPEEFESIADDFDQDRPDLYIADERNLAEVPDDDGGPAIPIIVLTGRHGTVGADPRIVGAIRRPAGLHELYRLAQQVLEDTPRATPRVPTHLSARCDSQGKGWSASVLSLSENGCLLRSPEPMLLGSRVTLSFDLPRFGKLEFEAETAYQLVPDMGMIFHATSPGHRAAIASYVTNALAAV